MRHYIRGPGYRLVFASEDSLIMTFDRRVTKFRDRLAIAIDVARWILTRETPTPIFDPSNRDVFPTEPKTPVVNVKHRPGTVPS
jgi:hypothetical protein